MNLLRGGIAGTCYDLIPPQALMGIDVSGSKHAVALKMLAASTNARSPDAKVILTSTPNVRKVMTQNLQKEPKWPQNSTYF